LTFLFLLAKIKNKESLPLTDMRYINGWVESLPLTDMRYINGWVESIVLRRKARDFFHDCHAYVRSCRWRGSYEENGILYH
jgi:hypothetical protein